MNKLKYIVTSIVTSLFIYSCEITKEEVILPGEAGVIYSKKGDLKSAELLLPGKYKVKRSDSVYILWTLEQSIQLEFESLTKDDSLIVVSLEVLYKPVKDSILKLYDRFGGQYEKRFIIPEARSSTRQNLTNYNYESVFSSSNNCVLDEIISDVDSIYRSNHIILTGLLNFKVKPTE